MGTTRGLASIVEGRVQPFAGPEDLIRAEITRLLRAPDGSLWAGTARGRLWRIDAAGALVKVFYEDSAGTMWIGTHGGGLSRFKDGRFASISTRHGLYNDNVFQIRARRRAGRRPAAASD